MLLRRLLIFLNVVYFVPFAFLAPLSAHAVKQHEGSALGDSTVVVGMLRTAEETYPEELTFSYNIAEMLTGLGVRVVQIDYNALLADFERTKGAISWTPGKQYEISDDEFTKIKSDVLDFIEKENISRIFIPGNFYNVDCEPYTPTPHRQLITNAITAIVRDNPSIRIMGICGGLQGIMHSLGVKITRIKNLVKSHESVAAHAISMPDPYDKNVQLHRVRVAPGSNLAGVLSKHLKPDANGWFSIYFPDAHGGVVSTDFENMQKLENLGYKVVGFADDGVVEVLEDVYGNMLFQDHPEALAIAFLKGDVLPPTDTKECASCSKFQDFRYKASFLAVSIMEYFLYR